MRLNTPQRLLNEHEVANSCSISVLTLRKWRSQKRGPQFVKIGALVRYRPEDVDAWIAEQKAQQDVALPEVER
ncbi:MAG: helix-turn-helix domain-containing protein [Bryobacteraceae bacterium]|nr:helix-turn-helix domain-containing protein [Bryobacteraceae bacterium]